MTLNVDGSGDSVLALTNTLDGAASVNAHSGALVGINVEQLLRRLERRPLSGNGDFRSGRTPFDDLLIDMTIAQGTVSVDKMHVDGPAVRLALNGQASVPMRDLDLKGTATLISTETDNQFELPFVVQGRWDDPILLPDAQSLIRHSGAAAPLLDAVKGHSAGEAVRSVIDKLMSNPSGNAAAPAPAAAAPKDVQ
jgi:AsmA protein